MSLFVLDEENEQRSSNTVDFSPVLLTTTLPFAHRTMHLYHLNLPSSSALLLFAHGRPDVQSRPELEEDHREGLFPWNPTVSLQSLRDRLV